MRPKQQKISLWAALGLAVCIAIPLGTKVYAVVANSITNVKVNAVSLTANGSIDVYDLTPTITGDTDSVASLTITINSDPVIGEVTADEEGAFTYTASPALTRGTHILNILSKDDEDNLASFAATLHVYQPHPDGTRIKKADDATVYVLEAGKKQPIYSAAAYASHYDTWDGIVVVSNTELTTYESGTALKFRTGALVKSTTADAVFLIQPEGTKRGFPSADVFTSLGYRWQDILVTSAAELALYTDAGVINPHSDDTIIKGTDSSVYLLDGSTIHLFPNAATFLGLGYHWDDVSTVSNATLEGYTVGDPLELTHLPGTLVKSEDAATVYLLDKNGGNTTKKPITAAASFESHDYDWSRIITIRDAELDGYTDATALLLRDGSIVKGSGGTVYAVEDNKKRAFGSAEVYEEMNYAWSSITTVPDALLTSMTNGTEII